MTPRLELPPIYPIVDLRDDTSTAIERAVTLAGTLAAAGATLIQLRAKTLASGVMTEVALRVVAAIAASGGRLIVNDRADVAAASGAAGVHLGDEDLPLSAARTCVGGGAIVGYSTHSLEDVARAATLAIDYIGFGPVFESPTKAGARAPVGIDALVAACTRSALPVVAIGGVTFERAPALWRAGAVSVAVISEIERATNPAALVTAYLAAATRGKNALG